MNAQPRWKITFGIYNESGEFAPNIRVSAKEVILDPDSPYAFYVDGLRMESSRDVVEIERLDDEGSG